MNFKNFKPQLISNEDYDLETLDYSHMVQSIKRDGVRIEATREGLYNRSLKLLANKELQHRFKAFCDTIPKGMVIEGEMIDDDLPCRTISGMCNAKNGGKDISRFKIYIFDMYQIPSDSNGDDLIGLMRNAILRELYTSRWLKSPLIELVIHSRVNSFKEAQLFYDRCIKDGYEGSVLNDMSKNYKRGRATIKQNIAYKLKPHKEEDLEIIGVNERFINTNESETNELGRSYKRNTVKDKRPTGIAATFTCRLGNSKKEISTDGTTKVTITGTEGFRREIWENKTAYIGQYAVVKSMDFGTKDKPRHPRLLSIKHKVEK